MSEIQMLDKPKQPVKFGSNGHIVPCGELTIHNASCSFVDREGAYPTCIWIDESGLLWNISRFVDNWELDPVVWPLDIRANYIITYGKNGSGSYPITADSYKAAYEKVVAFLERDGRSQYKNTIKLKRVCVPSD